MVPHPAKVYLHSLYYRSPRTRYRVSKVLHLNEKAPLGGLVLLTTITPQHRLTSADRRHLAIRHTGLVRRIAFTVGRRSAKNDELEDLVHHGLVGLLEALERYDPTQGVRLTTFVSTRVRGSMLDALRRRDFASRGARARLRELHRVEDELTGELGRHPTSEELASVLGVARTEVDRRRREFATGVVSSLDDPGDEARGGWHDRIADDGPSVERLVDLELGRGKLKEALAALSERERLVVALYYLEDLTIREIAEVVNLSPARVSQLHRQALKVLRQAMET